MDSLKKWEQFQDWDPLHELNEFQNQLNSLFGRGPTRHGDIWLTSDWSPAVDIIEDDKEFLVKAELPEIKKEDVHVTLENGVLTIQGERKMEKQENHRRFHRSERSYGVFTRSFGLPPAADSTQVRAEFKDGVLQVHLPKSEKAKPNQIEVKVE